MLLISFLKISINPLKLEHNIQNSCCPIASAKNLIPISNNLHKFGKMRNKEYLVKFYNSHVSHKEDSIKYLGRLIVRLAVGNRKKDKKQQ